MLKILRLTILYFMLTAIAVCVTKPANATLVLSDSNGVPVLYDASQGFAFLPIYNYGDIVFTGTADERIVQAENFATTIDYGGYTGWSLYTPVLVGNISFYGTLDDLLFAYSYRIFGQDNNDYVSYGNGVGAGYAGAQGFDDCAVSSPVNFADTSCYFPTASSLASHAIYILKDSDKEFSSNPHYDVSTPPIISIIGLGLLGIMSRRIKKKTI
jgi:hypothetical protein